MTLFSYVGVHHDYICLNSCNELCLCVCLCLLAGLTGTSSTAQQFNSSSVQQPSASAAGPLLSSQSTVSSAQAAAVIVTDSYQPRRKTNVAPISEVAIQDEIRTMIAQTEQLLTGALQPQPHQQLPIVQQALQPQPPQPTMQLTSPSPLRSSRLTLSEIARSSSGHQEASSTSHRENGAVPELTQQDHTAENELNGGDSTEDEADSVFSDESSEQDAETEHERDELSDGEMYPPSDLMFQQQGVMMQQQSRFMPSPQIQDASYHSVVQARHQPAEDEDELGDHQLLQDEEEESSATNRDINASKARALKESMVGNLIRLGFKENLTRMALDAGVQEIDHYDSDCELAYVDIFMSLVKMVCDAHLDSFSHRLPAHPNWMSPAGDSFALGGGDLIPLYAGVGSAPQTTNASLPFKWPVFDMAQFEFGNARAGTCFDSVCVLTNLPKVSMDRTEELMEILSCNLFCMIGDPIQVVIPSVSATGRTKGHAFLEFDDHQLAKACATAIDGLTWGRGPFGRIRSSMFRQYQVKSPTAPQMRFDGFRNDALGARMAALDTSTGSSTDPNDSVNAEYSHFDDDEISGGDHASAYFPSGGRLRLNPFATSSGGRDTPFSPLFGNRSLDPFPDSPLYTSSDDGGDNDGGDSDLLWEGARSAAPRGVTMSDMDEINAEFGGHEDLMAMNRRHSFADSSQSLEPRHPELFDLNDSPFSSDADDEDENGFGFGGNGVEDDTWGVRDPSALLQYEAANGVLGASRRLMQSQLRGLERLPHPLSGTTSHAHSNQQLREPRSAVKAQCSSSQDHLSSELPDADEATQTDESEKPWRSYCEELIARNREMQEQVAYARRRIVQLGHNNQKLHLLIDRVERDRDGLMFENDLLQNQLNGFEDHERHHEALLTELTILRKRMRKYEQHGLKGSLPATGLYLTPATLSVREGDEDEFHHHETNGHGHVSASLEDVRFVLHHQLGANALNAKNVDELKDWEQLLESSLTRVRVMKEDKALALQKKLDRQVEEQQELKLCVICLSNEKSILCLPCRHLCLCESCSAHEEVEKCPICRLHIDEMLLVYA